MTMDKLKTGSGKRLRTEALTETALPVPYDAAVMPGASVLGTDGRIYASTKNSAGIYEWASNATVSDSEGLNIRDVDVVPTFNGLVLGGQLIATTETTGPARLLLVPARDPNPAQPDTILGSIDFGSRSEVALSNRLIATPCRIIVRGFPREDWSENSKPASLRISLADRNTTNRRNRFQLEYDGSILFLDALGAEVGRFSTAGNLLLGNTTGTEKLSVTGKIQLTATADSYMVGTNNVVGSRKTGWAAPTGTATRTAFDTATVAVADLAQRLKALIDDLTSHGLIGA
jgi:hypothetical protein